MEAGVQAYARTKASFNDLVGKVEDRGRDRQTEGLRSLEIDDQLKTGSGARLASRLDLCRKEFD